MDAMVFFVVARWFHIGLSPLTLSKIKVLHDAIEEPFCLNGSIKNL